MQFKTRKNAWNYVGSEYVGEIHFILRISLIYLVVMCASTPDKVELLQPSADAKPGDRIECEGYDCSAPDAQIKKELSDQILPLLSTNEKGEATFKGVPWKVANGKGVIKSTSLTNVPIK